MESKNANNPNKLLQYLHNNKNVPHVSKNAKSKPGLGLVLNEANKENMGGNPRETKIKPKENPKKGHERYLPNILTHLSSTCNKNISLIDSFDHQSDINRRMRSILFNWLLEVQFKLKLKTRTIFLAANIFDRYLEFKVIDRANLQLVGTTCLLMASKYEDIYPPELKELYYLCEKTYTSQQFLDCENDIILHLNFDFVFVSALDVSEIKANLLNEEDKLSEEAIQLVLHIFLFHSHAGKFDVFRLADFARFFGIRLAKRDHIDQNEVIAQDFTELISEFSELLEALRYDKLHALEIKYKSLFLKLLYSDLIDK